MSDEFATEPTRGTVPMPRPLTGALRALIALDVFAMMALIFVDVFLRYLFNAPIAGGFEIIQFMLAVLIFSALPVVTWAEGHIVVSLFAGLFRGRGRLAQRVVVMAVSAFALGLIAYLMWHQGFSLRSSRQITGFLQVPIHPIAFVMCGFAAIACAIQLVMLGYLLAHSRGAMRRKREP